MEASEAVEAMRTRRSVRSYTDEPISADDARELAAEIERCNAESGLHIRLVADEPKAFDSTMAHYGKFSGVRNYLVLAGPDEPGLDERCGYYGERLVLLAQRLDLRTCWVALTFKKRYVRKSVARGDRLVVVIAIGHGAAQGAAQGAARKSKGVGEVSRPADGAPRWFAAGVDAALLAPTAMNQQKFEIELTDKVDGEGRPVVALRNRGGAYSKVDLGIVRLHFELGAAAAGGEFVWEGARL